VPLCKRRQDRSCNPDFRANALAIQICKTPALVLVGVTTAILASELEAVACQQAFRLQPLGLCSKVLGEPTQCPIQYSPATS